MISTPTPAEARYQEAMALLNIAQATLNEGTERQAFELLQASAEEGHLPAYIQLAECYDNGVGTDMDDDEAEGTLQRAAGLGSAKAAYLFAKACFYGRYDHDLAYTYVQKALEGEDAAGAHYLLGLLLYHGEGPEQDLESSFREHSMAAELGSTDAMFELYVYHSQGLGCMLDQKAAFDWDLKAAERGHFRACFNMGWCYETGTHVPQDLEQAFQWYTKASEGGNGKATAYLGVMVQKGVVKPATTLDADGSWNEAKARTLAESYYHKAERDRFFLDLPDYLAGLGVER